MFLPSLPVHEHPFSLDPFSSDPFSLDTSRSSDSSLGAQDAACATKSKATGGRCRRAVMHAQNTSAMHDPNRGFSTGVATAGMEHGADVSGKGEHVRHGARQGSRSGAATRGHDAGEGCGSGAACGGHDAGGGSGCESACGACEDKEGSGSEAARRRHRAEGVLPVRVHAEWRVLALVLHTKGMA